MTDRVLRARAELQWSCPGDIELITVGAGMRAS
jgi:hypothetical protein